MLDKLETDPYSLFPFVGPVAQQVEQRPFKAWVTGSNPVRLKLSFPEGVPTTIVPGFLHKQEQPGLGQRPEARY